MPVPYWSTFRRIWLLHQPHIKICLPSIDAYKEYYFFKQHLQAHERIYVLCDDHSTTDPNDEESRDEPDDDNDHMRNENLVLLPNESSPWYTNTLIT